LDRVNRRLDNPIEFEDAVKRAVPIFIGLSTLYSIEAQNFLDRLRKLATSKDAITWQDMLDAVQNALRYSVRSSSIRRTDIWTVEYTSNKASYSTPAKRILRPRSSPEGEVREGHE
jgi:hypothetical protein